MGSIEYHLRELGIALDKNDPRNVLPEVLESDQAVLDIGCGIGQSLLALGCTDKVCVGLDIDEEAIRYGTEHYGDKIKYVLGNAQKLPFPSQSFDLVFSRIALPYTNIPVVIKEIVRVLKPEGRVWMVLHSKAMVLKWLKEAMQARGLRRSAFLTYALLNGYLFKYCGVLSPYLTGGYESWQDLPAMKRLLERNRFKVQERHQGIYTILEGRLPA